MVCRERGKEGIVVSYSLTVVSHTEKEICASHNLFPVILISQSSPFLQGVFYDVEFGCVFLADSIVGQAAEAMEQRRATEVVH